jgi:hypothetical protein
MTLDAPRCKGEQITQAYDRTDDPMVEPREKNIYINIYVTAGK